MSANERQVSGSHYKPKKEGSIQHWDYCVRSETPNLEYAASKYVTRWRKKNGIVDLEKALHYVEKRIESYRAGVGAEHGGLYLPAMFKEFIADNEVPVEEALIIYNVMHWVRLEDLNVSRIMLEAMIVRERVAEEEASKPTSGYVNQDR